MLQLLNTDGEWLMDQTEMLVLILPLELEVVEESAN